VSQRVVLCCWGSYGDLFPYLAIAARLKRLGHHPVLSAPGYYREMVEREGIAFHAARPDIDPADSGTIARVMDPVRGTEAIVRELLVPFVRDAFHDLVDVVAGADLVVTHPVTFAASIAADAKRVPWLSSVLAPTSLFSVHDFPLLPPYPLLLHAARSAPWAARAFMRLARHITGPWTEPVRAFRRELGLRDYGDPLYEGQFSPQGTLALFSPVFGPPQPDWPQHTTATGFVFRQGTEALTSDLKRFLDDGPAPIVFTLGTSAVGAAGSFYEESARAATMIGRRGVLLVGRDPRNRSPALPSGIMTAEYAPHEILFPRAAAIVHHGGVGTTARALASGRPMLVVPHAHDQPDNAFRATKLGVARTISAGAFNARRAGRDLEVLLSEPSYAERATAVGRAIAGEDGVRAACEVILDRASSFRRDLI